MSSKSNNPKVNNSNNTKGIAQSLNDLIYAPKTPIKRLPLQHSNIYSKLSPLHVPPKIQARIIQAPSNAYHEMLYVETPLHKQNERFMVDEGQDGMNYAIENIIIFQSSEENNRNKQSSIGSSEEQEDELSPNEDNKSMEGQYSQDSQNQEINSQADPQSKIDQLKIHRTLKNKPQENTSKDTTKKIMCNCKKTKCLKLYCDCFRLNQTCDGCNCVGCHNLDIYNEQRNNAIMTLMDRNPDPFGQKIEADKHVKGCNCKKSNCLKKYCQCYQAGLKCGDNCKCEECKNNVLEGEGDYDEEKGVNKNTAKKERKMVEI